VFKHYTITRYNNERGHHVNSYIRVYFVITIMNTMVINSVNNMKNQKFNTSSLFAKSSYVHSSSTSVNTSFREAFVSRRLSSGIGVTRVALRESSESGLELFTKVVQVVLWKETYMKVSFSLFQIKHLFYSFCLCWFRDYLYIVCFVVALCTCSMFLFMVNHYFNCRL